MLRRSPVATTFNHNIHNGLIYPIWTGQTEERPLLGI